jgi:hypothetical protein
MGSGLYIRPTHADGLALTALGQAIQQEQITRMIN